MMNEVAELEAVIQVWTEAWKEKDEETVDRLMAPDYAYISPWGEVFEREMVLEMLRSKDGLFEGGPSEIDVRLLGDEAALIRHRWRGVDKHRGKTLRIDKRFITICVQVDGEWRIVQEQCSALGA